MNWVLLGFYFVMYSLAGSVAPHQMEIVEPLTLISLQAFTSSCTQPGTKMKQYKRGGRKYDF